MPQSGNATTILTIETDPVLNANSSILRTFLLGCDSKTSSFECGLLPKAVKNSLITVEIYGTSSGNTTISFSYVIFSPSTAGFTSYGGYLTNQSLQGTYATSLHKTMAFTPYRFHGLSYLNFSTLAPSKISTIIDDDLVFQIQSSTFLDRYAIFHLIFGRTAKSACGNQYQNKALCVSTCPG